MIKWDKCKCAFETYIGCQRNAVYILLNNNKKNYFDKEKIYTNA